MTAGGRLCRQYTRAYNAAMTPLQRRLAGSAWRTRCARWLSAALARFAIVGLGLPGFVLAGSDPSSAMSASSRTEQVTVLAAVSLSDVLTATAAEFTRRTGIPVRQSFASTAQLARQLEAGARADLVIAADREWMDHLAAAQLVRPASRRVLAGNTLVIVAPRRSTVTLDPKRAVSWLAALNGERLVTGDPDSVPLGRYAQEALERLGAWAVVAPRLARAENARAALALVARGEAGLGIVYATDARSEPRVRLVAALDPTLHTPVEYPAALTPEAGGAAARYLEFLDSAAARQIFGRYGFKLLPRTTRERSASPRSE